MSAFLYLKGKSDKPAAICVDDIVFVEYEGTYAGTTKIQTRAHGLVFVEDMPEEVLRLLREAQVPA